MAIGLFKCRSCYSNFSKESCTSYLNPYSCLLLNQDEVQFIQIKHLFKIYYPLSAPTPKQVSLLESLYSHVQNAGKCMNHSITKQARSDPSLKVLQSHPTAQSRTRYITLLMTTSNQLLSISKEED